MFGSHLFSLPCLGSGSLNPYHFQEQSLINQCDPNQAGTLQQYQSLESLFSTKAVDKNITNMFKSSYAYFPQKRTKCGALKVLVFLAEIHAQSNNALLERPAGFLATHINSNKHLSPPDHAPQLECVSHHQASKENGKV